MLRERLKNMEIKITEMADYLQISRPTMYKFIEYYDLKEFDLINKKVLKLFNYINENELIGKKNVVNYILTKLVDVKEMNSDDDLAIIKTIKKYIISNPESKKSQFLVTCATKDLCDDIIAYLVEITPLLKKKVLTSEEEILLEPYKIFKKNLLEKGDVK